MRYHDKYFCKAFSEFFNCPIDSPTEIEMGMKNGTQISDFCDHYFKVRLENSALRHFDLQEKSRHLKIGLFILFAILAALAILIVAYFFIIQNKGL